MSRRIDIELTSDRDDGSWTWRAAGAKQPKGVLDGGLLPSGAAVGDALRADVETSLDGTEVLAVLAPKAKNRAAAETIELTARGLSDDELVITTLAPKRGGRDRDRGGDRGDRSRGPRRDGDRPPRGDRRPGGDRTGAERPGGSGRPGGGGSQRPSGPRSDGPAPRDRPEGERTERPRRDRPAPPAKPRAKRLRPGRTHRRAALDSLAPEEQVIAEQVLRGGVAAVRQAVDKMNEEARAEGRAEVKAEPLVIVAERLLPPLRVAEWRDRAEAAVADLDELDLRDLRSVVVGAETGAKDDESRALAAQLREGLVRRVDQEQSAWLAEIAENLADGRTVRALRLSSRPPKAGAPLPVALAATLSDAAGAALTAESVTDRWATVLDALSFSPVRLTVVPASKPAEPRSELVAVITRVAGRVPKVAEAFGIEPPAETGRARSARPGGKARGKGTSGRPPKPPRSADGAPPIPPPPSPRPSGADSGAVTPAATSGAETDGVAAVPPDAGVDPPPPVGAGAQSDAEPAPVGSEPSGDESGGPASHDQSHDRTSVAEAEVVDVTAALVEAPVAPDPDPATGSPGTAGAGQAADVAEPAEAAEAAGVVDVTAAVAQPVSSSPSDPGGSAGPVEPDGPPTT